MGSRRLSNSQHPNLTQMSPSQASFMDHFPWSWESLDLNVRGVCNFLVLSPHNKDLLITDIKAFSASS